MTVIPIALNADESVLRSDEHAAHVVSQVIGTGVRAGTLWLTSQRIVFQPSLFGGLLAYPLRRIVEASRSNTPIYSRSGSGMAGRTSTYDSSLFLRFDNGGQEYFIPTDVDAWVSAVREAQGAAPSLPYTQVPAARSNVGTNRGLFIFLGIVVGIFVLFLCSVMACFGVPLLTSLLGGNGG